MKKITLLTLNLLIHCLFTQYINCTPKNGNFKPNPKHSIRDFNKKQRASLNALAYGDETKTNHKYRNITPCIKATGLFILAVFSIPPAIFIGTEIGDQFK